MGFKKDDYVKIVATNGDYRYGYIEKITERGGYFLVCLHEEGESAVEFEMQAGTLAPTFYWGDLLTDAERAIIPLLARGLANTEIAEKLDVSPVTIRSQVRTLRNKLQMETRQQLVIYCSGMVEEEEEE